MSDRAARVEALFDAAVDLAPGDRAALLEGGCGGDAALRAEVERLLAADARAASAFPASPVPALLAVAQSADPFPAGTRVGRFSVLARLGAGGMGVVLLAYDERLDRRVALKLLAADVGGADASRRMLREAQALATLSHPNVVQVFDAGEVDGRLFLAMEYVPGGTLADAGTKDLAAAAVIARYVQAAAGLAAAHRAGLVHRDFKPANVLVGGDGRVRVADFGLARRDGSAAAARAAVPPGALDELRTLPGAVMGTPAFMAPEQFRAEPCSAAGDQFSFCVALYRALYDAAPYGTDARRAWARGEPAVLPAPPRAPGVPDRVHAVLARGLATEPAARFASMDALIDALTAAAGIGRPYDPGAARWQRGVLVVVAATIATVATALVETGRLRFQTPEQMLGIAVINLANVSALSIVLRKQLAKSPFNRVLFHAGLVMLAGVMLHRVGGVMLGTSTAELLQGDLFVYAGVMGALALVVDAGFWWVVAVCGACALWISAAPAHATRLYLLANVSAFGVWLWRWK